MIINQIADIIGCPFVVVEHSNGTRELFNSLNAGADLPPDVANLPVRRIRTAELPWNGGTMFAVIVIDV